MTTTLTCSIDGCDKPRRARGWCVNHWTQWRRTGDPVPKTIYGDDLARFWSKVDKREPDECWPWLGAIDKDGYGRMRWGDTHLTAHHAAHTLLIGPVPPGWHVDHVYARGCIRRDCVNPHHLEAVTPAENVRRGEPARRTHCPRGHEYTPENTSTTSGTGRTCVTCNRERNARRRARSAQSGSGEEHCPG